MAVSFHLQHLRFIHIVILELPQKYIWISSLHLKLHITNHSIYFSLPNKSLQFSCRRKRAAGEELLEVSVPNRRPRTSAEPAASSSEGMRRKIDHRPQTTNRAAGSETSHCHPNSSSYGQL